MSLLGILLRSLCRVSESCTGSDWPAVDQQRVTMIFFGAILAFGSVLELLIGPTTELGHCMLYKIHFSSHITIQLRNCSLLSRIREDNTSKQFFFIVFAQLMGHPLIEFFTFPICFKC